MAAKRDDGGDRHDAGDTDEFVKGSAAEYQVERSGRAHRQEARHGLEPGSDPNRAGDDGGGQADADHGSERNKHVDERTGDTRDQRQGPERHKHGAARHRDHVLKDWSRREEGRDGGHAMGSGELRPDRVEQRGPDHCVTGEVDGLTPSKGAPQQVRGE